MRSAISRTRRRVSSEMAGLSASARDTVESDTPARRATAAMSLAADLRFFPRLTSRRCLYEPIEKRLQDRLDLRDPGRKYSGPAPLSHSAGPGRRAIVRG